jgi:hypothetical protein
MMYITLSVVTPTCMFTNSTLCTSLPKQSTNVINQLCLLPRMRTALVRSNDPNTTASNVVCTRSGARTSGAPYITARYVFKCSLNGNFVSK